MSMVSQIGLLQSRHEASRMTRGISTAPIYDHFCRMVASVPTRGALLDFGSGSGQLLEELHSLGSFETLAGADLMERPRRLAGDVVWSSCDLNQPLPYQDGNFDVIVSSEVIEHLENPRAVTREWSRLLRPGGTLILSTPNCESWRSILSLMFQGHFAAFNDLNYPAHVTALVRKDIQRILGEAGFTDISFSFVDSGCIPKLRGITWQQVSGGLLRGRRFSDNIVARARKPDSFPSR